MDLCIIGSGYVGLVSGACFAEVGHHVVCVDNDQRKIDALLAGRIPIYDPGHEDLVHRNVALTYIERVAREIGGVHKPGQYRVIVDKSTVPVKTGQKVGDTIKRYNK